MLSSIRRVTVVLGCLAALTACSDDASPPSVSTPSAVPSPATSTATAVAGPGAVALPLNGAQTAQVDVTAGATAIAVHVGGAGASLITVVPQGPAAAPKVLLASHTVTVTASGGVDIWLNPSVYWAVHIGAAATSVSLDLTGVHLAGVTVDAPVATLTMNLGTPVETIPILIGAAITSATVHLATGARAVLTAADGTGHVSVDGQGSDNLTSTQLFPVPGGSPGAFAVTFKAACTTLTLDHVAAP